MIAAFFVAFSLACSDDPDPQQRLIPPSDQDYADLETPEAAGECYIDEHCEAVCEHKCAPVPDGPVTCPADPPPSAERITDAYCLCDGSICAWYEWTP